MNSMNNSRGATQQWYELRIYTFDTETQRQFTSTWLEQAYLPALSHAGIHNIGVFTESQPGSGIPRTFLLIPFDSIEAFAGLDAVYPWAATTAPAYQRIESNLLKAFAHMPTIEVPEKKPRLFELRRYESPTEAAGKKKIEMFNEAGEIDIFKKIGARPVFFGETLIGQYRPNLTYMLTFDDMADHDTRWKAFGADPDWQRIKNIPEYADSRIISKITRTFLQPTPFSQV